MADFNAVAGDIFEVIRSFNYDVLLYDENGMDVTEPEDARRFIAHPRNLMISLIDDDDNSRITFSIGKSTHASDVMGLGQKLRTLTTKYNLIYREQQHGKVISPKQFAQLASITEREERMHIYEGMYGTSRSSYLRLENARMIVRHKNRIDDSQIGARGRCVESIFVENASGERHLLPTTNLMAGRAMTQHVNQGGQFHDPLGQQINNMAVEYGHLGAGAQAMSEAATMVREACRNKRGKLRKTFERLARPTTYAEQASSLADQATVLNETPEPIADTRIDELREILGEQPREVYECCCRAIDEAGEEEPYEPDRADVAWAKAPTVSVVGHRVNTPAWDDFKHQVLDIIQPPKFDRHAVQSRHGARNVFGELAYRLGQIANVVQDDTMANLLGFVSEQLPQESDPRLRDKYKLIAIQALRAVGAMPSALASKNESVVEHVTWLNKFDPDRILLEIGLDPMDPSFPHDTHDRAENMALDDFDGDVFVDSPEMQDVISGRDPHDPEENTLTKQEIMGALEAYLRHYIETYNPEFSDTGYEGAEHLASSVYEAAVHALHSRGFVIGDVGLAEEEELLTREDVLLPSKNQGDDLEHEVSKSDVIGPDGEHGKPDDAYTSRLMTLAGMRGGTPSAY